MLRLSKRAVMFGMAALAIAVLGLALAVMDPVTAAPNDKKGEPSKDPSNNGLVVRHLGL